MIFVVTISQLVLALCCIAAAGVAKAFMDESAESRFTGKRSSWNKGSSFLEKWKLDTKGDRIPQPQKLWYYLFGFTPQYQEKFYYSSTVLVFLTDKWHLFQFITFNCIYLGFAFLFYPHWPWMLLVFASCKVIMNMRFAFTRRFVLKNKT